MCYSTLHQDRSRWCSLHCQHIPCKWSVLITFIFIESITLWWWIIFTLFGSREDDKYNLFRCHHSPEVNFFKAWYPWYLKEWQWSTVWLLWFQRIFYPVWISPWDKQPRPHFPQSNGQVERAVQTMEKLLQKSNDPYLALLNYWATPLHWCGFSPAELLMGR